MNSNDRNLSFGSGSIVINEFSRGFNYRFDSTYGDYVATAYSEAIDRCSAPVPESIVKMIETQVYQLNDNYPPEKQNYSLIAWEKDQYSVLAVATQIIEVCNSDERVTIAYRYFWLARSELSEFDPEIDGILTLLNWWSQNGQPKPQLDPSIQPQTYATHPVSKQLSYSSKQPLPIPFIIYHPDKVIQPYRIHEAALGLGQIKGRPVAWVWNAGHLQQPSAFLVIHCRDEATYREMQEANASVSDRVKTVRLVQELPGASNRVAGTGLKFIEPDKEQEITSLLKALDPVRSETSNYQTTINDLIRYLTKYPPNIYNWGRCLDKTKLKQPQFQGTMALFVPELIVQFLQFKPDRRQINTFITHYEKLQYRLKNCKFDLKLLLAQQTQTIISLILNAVCFDQLEPEIAKQIVLRSKGKIWQPNLRDYARNLLKLIIHPDPQSEQSDSFLINLRKKMSQKILNYDRAFLPVAEWLTRIGNHSLAAIFYHFGNGRVPDRVYQKIHVLVIPLKSEAMKEQGWGEVGSQITPDSSRFFHKFAKAKPPLPTNQPSLSSDLPPSQNICYPDIRISPRLQISLVIILGTSFLTLCFGAWWLVHRGSFNPASPNWPEIKIHDDRRPASP